MKAKNHLVMHSFLITIVSILILINITLQNGSFSGITGSAAVIKDDSLQDSKNTAIVYIIPALALVSILSVLSVSAIPKVREKTKGIIKSLWEKYTKTRAKSLEETKEHLKSPVLKSKPKKVSRKEKLKRKIRSLDKVIILREDLKNK